MASNSVIPLAPDGEAPAWSPDGTRIAYTRGDGIFTISPNGAAQRRIATLSRSSDQHFLDEDRLSWRPRPLVPSAS